MQRSLARTTSSGGLVLCHGCRGGDHAVRGDPARALNRLQPRPGPSRINLCFRSKALCASVCVVEQWCVPTAVSGPGPGCGSCVGLALRRPRLGYVARSLTE